MTQQTSPVHRVSSKSNIGSRKIRRGSVTDDYISQITDIQSRVGRGQTTIHNELSSFLADFKKTVALPLQQHDFNEYTSNDSRARALLVFRKSMLLGLTQDVVPIDNASASPQPTKGDDYLLRIANSTELWGALRYRYMVKLLRLSKPVPNQYTKNLERLHWALRANQSSLLSVSDTEADEAIWQKFAVDVRGKSDMMPSTIDIDGALEWEKVREEALEYFEKEFASIFPSISSIDIMNALIFALDFDTCSTLINRLFPIALKVVPPEEMKKIVFPKLILHLVIDKHNNRTMVVKELMQLGSSLIDVDLVNSVMEYSSHVKNAEYVFMMIEDYPEMVKTEGIAIAYILGSSKGDNHILSLLELTIMERIDASRLEGSNELLANNISIETTTGAFRNFITPFVYNCLVSAAFTGHAMYTTISSLIDFYEKTFKDDLRYIVNLDQHDKFIANLFQLACKKNHVNIVWSLIYCEWIPEDLLPSLRETIEEGHQKVLHVLLESLLAPDPEVKTQTGALPIIFRKASLLRALPMVAKRFPGETAWFLNELSNIPVPNCVPKTSEHDPLIHSKSLKGVKLGRCLLKDCTKLPDPSVSPQSLWNVLRIEGQLSKASQATTKEKYDTESVICVAPETMITEEAYTDTFVPSYLRQTNALIRLLSTGDQKIILTPVIKSLMEYHWSSGYFWGRFSIQLTLVFCFICSCAILFTNVVNQSITGQAMDLSTLVATSVVTLSLSSFFLFQELRQFLDDPRDYISSFTNIMDLGIHICVILVVFRGAIGQQYIPPLLLGIVILLLAMRLLLHLRIIPSVGPLVRIMVVSSIHVSPILIPMGVMYIAFAAGIFLVENSVLSHDTRWNGFWMSLQYTITMITYDYAVLDDPTNFSVFVLRMLYHVLFIIFFVSVIVALITVNIAEISSNSTATWFVEVAELMVELELYWPYPISYQKVVLDRSWTKPDRKNSFGFGSNLISYGAPKDLESQYDSLGTSGGSPKSFSEPHVILYTSDREDVASKTWWTAYPSLVNETSESKNDQTPPSPLSQIKQQISNADDRRESAVSISNFFGTKISPGTQKSTSSQSGSKDTRKQSALLNSLNKNMKDNTRRSSIVGEEDMPNNDSSRKPSTRSEKENERRPSFGRRGSIAQKRDEKSDNGASSKSNSTKYVVQVTASADENRIEAPDSGDNLDASNNQDGDFISPPQVAKRISFAETDEVQQLQGSSEADDENPFGSDEETRRTVKIEEGDDDEKGKRPKIVRQATRFAGFGNETALDDEEDDESVDSENNAKNNSAEAIENDANSGTAKKVQMAVPEEDSKTKVSKFKRQPTKFIFKKKTDSKENLSDDKDVKNASSEITPDPPTSKKVVIISEDKKDGNAGMPKFKRQPTKFIPKAQAKKASIDASSFADPEGDDEDTQKLSEGQISLNRNLSFGNNAQITGTSILEALKEIDGLKTMMVQLERTMRSDNLVTRNRLKKLDDRLRSSNPTSTPQDGVVREVVALHDDVRALHAMMRQLVSGNPSNEQHQNPRQRASVSSSEVRRGRMSFTNLFGGGPDTKTFPMEENE